jgi:hypothetical protein
VREALGADLLPLVRGGVQFTVSTDNHSLRHTSKPFDPQAYCAELGIDEHNTNGLVRELLARRALPAAAARPPGAVGPLPDAPPREGGR